MMLNIESTLHYLRMKVLYKLTYLVFLYILYSVFHEAWENEWSCFGGRFCCMFSVLPAFYSEFYFSLTSQQPVICVTSAFKETTLELSHLSLNGPTELCCTPPLPPPPQSRDAADQLVSCHSCLRFGAAVIGWWFPLGQWTVQQETHREAQRPSCCWLDERQIKHCLQSLSRLLPCTQCVCVCVSSR